jgi:hypothetical protein
MPIILQNKYKKVKVGIFNAFSDEQQKR